jgi:hypothetical protein
MEVAINLPFESNEIKDIVTHELRLRLDQLSPLMGAKEYAAFEIAYNVTIRLQRPGDDSSKQTLAWGVAKGRELDPDGEDILSDVIHDDFKSGDPNEERIARKMPLTVEVAAAGGGKTRKKVTFDE